MKKILVLLSISVLLSGCATTIQEEWKRLTGRSVYDVEQSKKDALVKIFDLSYEACYAKAEKALTSVLNISIYSRSENLIAVYYVDLNTTPVGVFFESIDDKHTKVEVSSPAPGPKNAVAKLLFEGKKPKDVMKPRQYTDKYGGIQ
jgi:hypothetical protein